jgi:hypothetical protein
LVLEVQAAGGRPPEARRRDEERLHFPPLACAASKVIRAPVKAPRANAYAERWVRTVRTERLDWLLILNRRHLEGVLRVYVHHYKTQRPHRGLKLSTPEESRELEPIASAVRASVCRRDLQGGLPHEHYQAAA